MTAIKCNAEKSNAGNKIFNTLLPTVVNSKL